MKRKFTKLLAAIALLVFMTPTMVGWGQTWELATSIQVGDVVVLVTENDKMELTGISTASTKYGIGTTYQTVPAAAYPLTVVAGYSDDTFAFKNGDNYLFWTSGNSLAVNSTLSDNTSWTVSFGGNNGTDVTIKNNADAARQIWWNVGSPRFACYTDKSHGNSFHITSLYKQVSGGGDTPTITISGEDISNNAASFAYNNTSSHLATVSCQNFSGTPNPTIGVYTDLECTTAYTGSDFTAAFAANSTTTVNYGFANVNNSTTEARTLYMRASEGEVNSNVVTVTQAKKPVTYTTISDLFNGATGTETPVLVTFNNWVVSGVSIDNKSVFVTDGTNGFIMFDGNATLGNSFSAGKTLAGTITCDLVLYKGSAELKNVNASDLTISDGGNVTPANVTMAALAGINTGALVSYSNLTCSVNNNKYYLTDGTTTIQVYNALYAFGATLQTGHKYNITGVYQQYDNTKEIMPRSADDIEEVQDPVINASNPETLAYNATSGSIPYTISHPTSATLTATLQTGITWIRNVEVGAASVTFNVETNNGNADRTATITLSYTGATDKTVTVTQGHYQVDYATLPFAYDGNGAGTLPDGLTVHGTNTYGSSPAIKFDDADSNGIEDYVILKINETPGILTFVIKGNSFSGGKFRVETSANGTDYTTKEEYTVIPSSNTLKTISDLASSVRYIKWSYTKVSGNVAFGDINLAKYVDPSTIPAIDADDVAVTYNATEGSIVYEIDNYVAGTMTANTTASWIRDFDIEQVDEIGQIDFVVTPNTSTNPRSATVNLTYTYNTNQTVTKEVTVTQAGKPAIIIASPVQLTAAANDNGTIDVTYANFTPADKEINLYDDQECTTDFSGNWFDASFAAVSRVTDFNHIDYRVDANTGAARTVYMKVEVMDANLDMVFAVVSITQAAYSAPGTWVLTSLAELTPADVFVIVGTRTDATYGGNYAMSNDKGTSAPSTVAVTVDNGTLSGVIASNIQWNLSVSSDGYTFYPAGYSNSYLYCTNTNNGVKVGTGYAKHFNLSDDGYLTTTETSDQRYIGIYNAQDWRCYTSSGGNIANQTFAFYKKVSADVTYTKQNIAAYTAGTNDHYYLIASPVASVTPNDGNGFFKSDYDLYYFDESQEGYEWRNYEATSFNLVSGKGYLYASNTTTDLTFNGQPYNGNGLVELAYTEGKPFAGWNLIGNPYASNTTLDKPYYRLNIEGSALNTDTEDAAIAAMEGVFVQATEANQHVVFTAQTRGEKQAVAKANLQVIGHKGEVIDNAIVRFDGGQTLGKFQLRENSTKVYFTEEGSDYAIVNAKARGEMPVNFKAAENGTYTISVEAENLDVDYLHLIDNMTGMDVDLLATPNYTFEGKKSDYASRFKLVFSTNADNNEVDEDFAFISDGNIIVLCEGEATLQVIDIMGRIISTQTVNGNASVNNVGTAGVYVLQLINGNNVKTQKIVVR